MSQSGHQHHCVSYGTMFEVHFGLITPSALQQAKELLRVRNYVNNVLAHATGQPVEKIQHDFNRNK